MKKVYTSSDHVQIGYLQGILEDQKIHCLIKNEMLQGAAGEIPVLETWPEIWVTDNRDEPLAKTIIEQALAPPKWQREWIEGQFTECWKCNASKPKTC